MLQRKFESLCLTSSCRSSKTLCYTKKKGCTFYDVAMNPDLFVFRNKVMSETSDRDASYLKKSISDLKTEDSRLFRFLKEELREIKQSQATLREQILETGSGLRIKVKIQTSFEIIMRANRRVFVEVLSEGDNLESFSVDDFREMLNFAFEGHVQSLAQYLENFKDDSLRTALLYPSSCNKQCIDNYMGLYLIWNKALKKTFRRWNLRFKYYTNCDRKRWRMTQYFNQITRRYPVRVRNQLRDFFKFVVVSQICKPF